MSELETIEIEDFYALPTLRTISKAIFFLLSNEFLREISNYAVFNYNTLKYINKVNANSKVEIRVVKENRRAKYTKGEIRQWIQASVWYLNQPIMILRNKEYFSYDTLPSYFITDLDLHKQMVGYIFSLIKETKIEDRSSDPGSFDTKLLYRDDTLDFLQTVYQPEVYNLDWAKKAINNI